MHAAREPAVASTPAPEAADFAKWFPGLPLSCTACVAPRWRVLCFPSAGSAEDMFTSKECLAVQAPGRMMRGREAPFTRAADLAAALLPVVASRLSDGVPYVVIGHSVGTWVAYELLAAAAAAGLPAPRAAWLSAMPAPDLPPAERPWRAQRGLSEAEFMEECRGWDVNEVVFTPALWPTYQSLMRADFTLFDEYEFRGAGSPPFSFPITVFHGDGDRRITEAHVRGWARFTTGAFACRRMRGHHLWPLQRSEKAAWLQAVVDEMAALASGPGVA
ncbi:hypothetical protein WJX81_007166 [Elliptochloris bilobata]|uniref:Thioesterase domain-containing protein n=1 Tax=Elliptochloris bilobata TaxID=381761 RepID=A0AAW1S8Z1_9CHLO